MIQTSVAETRFLLGRRASGITRMVVGRIAYKSGDRVVLCTPDQEPYAKATVMSVKPGTVKGRMSDDEGAKRDGFTNAISWGVHWRKRYGGADGKTVRMQLRIDEAISPEGKWSDLTRKA